MNIVVNGLLTYYEQTGKGSPVLLLHGWGDSSKGFQKLQSELAKNHQVLALDLPGFGASESQHEPWDLDNYAVFVQAFLQKLQVHDLHAVIGHSNGGALAIRGIAQGILKPQRLVLLAASGIRKSRSLRRLAMTVLAKVGNAATLWLPDRVRRNLRQRLYTKVGSDMLVVPHLEQTFKQTVRQDVQADAAALQLPTLLIYGDQDDAVPIKDAYTYERLISGSRLQIIQGAGHFVHLEKANIVNRLIMDFLQ